MADNPLRGDRLAAGGRRRLLLVPSALLAVDDRLVAVIRLVGRLHRRTSESRRGHARPAPGCDPQLDRRLRRRCFLGVRECPAGRLADRCSISLAARNAPAVALCFIGPGVIPMMLRPCEAESKGSRSGCVFVPGHGPHRRRSPRLSKLAIDASLFTAVVQASSGTDCRIGSALTRTGGRSILSGNLRLTR